MSHKNTDVLAHKNLSDFGDFGFLHADLIKLWAQTKKKKKKNKTRNP